MPESSSAPAVVAGIDGSRAAIRAALWGVDEAVSRDIPLRLLYALNQSGQTSPVDDAAGKVKAAGTAVRDAYTAVESSGKPVKIEVEIAKGGSVAELIRASASAAMLCVGAIGFNHFAPSRVGSTAVAVAADAHCPVAIIREPRRRNQQSGRWIYAEFDNSAGSDVVMEAAMEEARLRGLSVRAVTCWQSRFTDIHDPDAIAQGNRRARAQLDRRLAQWTRRYADVTVNVLAVHGTVINDLAKHIDCVELVVAGGHNYQNEGPLVGRLGDSVLHHTDCSLLVVGHRHL